MTFFRFQLMTLLLIYKMTNLQKALDLLFVAKVAVSNSLLLNCPDPKFEKYLLHAQEQLSYAESVLVELVPSSEVLSLFNSIYHPKSSKK